MNLKKVFFTVTPLSKALALVLLVLLPLLGLLIGIDYKRSLLQGGPTVSVDTQLMLHQAAKHKVHASVAPIK